MLTTQSGAPLHRIGIGTGSIGGVFLPDKSFPVVDTSTEDKSLAAIRYSITKGQNHLDTAFIYGLGYGEEIIGKAISGFNRQDLFIATKLWKSHLKPKSIIKYVQDALTRLQTDYLDLLYLHYYWEYEPLEDQIFGLNQTLDSGLVRYIGVSNFNLDQLKRAVKLSRHPISVVQVQYNLNNRSVVTSEYLKYCYDQQITIVAYRPLDRGAVSNPQVALAWLLSKPNLLTIPLSTDPAHIDENLKSLDFELTHSEIKSLDALGCYEDIQAKIQ